LGIIEDPANRGKLAKLTRLTYSPKFPLLPSFRWISSKNLTSTTSFDDYISRCKPGQDYIYYIAGEKKEDLVKHPTLQALLKKGYEVPLLREK